MPSTFPPHKDGELLTMATQASTAITLSPPTYGLTTGQASALATLVTAYTTAYDAATNPATRTKPTLLDKDAAKAALVQNLRDLNRFVQATKTVTDGQKAAIGFPVYATRAPIPKPTNAPVLEVQSTEYRIAKVLAREPGVTRRGLPPGVHNLLVVSYVAQGSTPPPTDPLQWKLEGLPTRPQFSVEFASTLAAGSQVYLAAAYVNPRGQAGPLCPPVSFYIGGGLGATDGLTMRIAA